MLSIYLWCLALTVLSFVYMLFFGRDKDGRLAILAIALFAVGVMGLAIEREKAGEGKPMPLEKLPAKTTWEVLLQKSVESNDFLAFIKNQATEKVVLVISPESLPEKFKVLRTGLIWKRTWIIPIKEEEK